MAIFCAAIFALPFAAKLIPLPFAKRTVHYSWFHPQRAQDVSIPIRNTQYELTADTLTLEKGLLRAWRKPRPFHLENASLQCGGKQLLDPLQIDLDQGNDQITFTARQNESVMSGSLSQGELSFKTPLTLKGRYASVPFTLHLSRPAPFSSLSDLSVPHGTLHLGKLKFKPKKKLPITLLASLPPLQFTVDHGIVHFTPATFQVEHLGACELTGTIDLNTGQLDLLAKAKLSEDFTLKIPLRGPIGEFKLEKQLGRIFGLKL